jgi:hypothetical protein
MHSLNAELSKLIDEIVTPLIAGKERICIIDPPAMPMLATVPFSQGAGFLRHFRGG